tara:strand:- start:14008 stop:14184 length:177 start_codon:yes stop_codon:yes gene_type:complete
MGMNEESLDLSIEELKVEIDDLKDLVKTLLTIIMEEADGVESGSAPQITNHPSRGYVM